MAAPVKLFKSAPPTAKVSIVIIALYIFAGVFAPLVTPYGETEVVGEVWESAGSPTQSGGITLLGTDHLGRDLYTRLMYGARNTIAIALATTVLSFSVGFCMGFLAAAVGAWTDQLLSRVVDILMSFPTLIFALIVLTVVGTSVPMLIVVIAPLDFTRVFRLSRAVAMDIEVMDFVEVARLRGEGLWWIMRYEILPNTLTPLVAEFGLRFCFVFLFISALSFLGLGIQPPNADWGGMVRENAGAITFGIYTPLLPAAAIAILTVSVNFVVDWFLHKTAGLRDEY